MITLPTIDQLNAIDLTGAARLVPQEYHYFFLGKPGFAPYRLLAYFSTLFSGQTIVEVGVHNGWGSLALLDNRDVSLVGFDIDLSTLDPRISDCHAERADFCQGLAHKIHPKSILNAPFIHFDAQHDGIYEKIFFDFLADNDYKGLLLLDDIRQNDAMRTFWDSITLTKQDLTELGHETGTGLVYFNP